MAFRGDDRIACRLIPADPSLMVRPITAADEEFCRALFHDDRGAMFRPLGLPLAALRALLDQQLAAQRAGFGNSYPDAEHLLIMRQDAAVGRLIVSLRHARDGELSLVVIDILISNAARSTGIGTAVLRSLERAATALGARQIELSVLHSNAGARQLYRRLGYFERCGDTHIAMVKPLASSLAPASAAANRSSPA
jgi:ribosomal protein S18 acetylase RimI-like enzyme